MHNFHTQIQQLDTQRVYQVAALMLTVSIGICVFINHVVLDISLQDWPGSSGYGIIAKNIAEQGRYSADGIELTARRPPLYPYFLSAFFRAFGTNGVAAAYLAQAVLYIGTGLLLVRFCLTRFRDNGMALAFCFLYSLHFYFGVESLWQRETILFSFILGAFLFPMTRVPGWKTAVLWGSLAGLLYLTRPTGVILPVVLLLGSIPDLKEHGAAKIGRHFAGCVAVFLITTLPWNFYVIRNFDGHQSLPTTSGPENLYKGHIDDFERIFPSVDLDLYNPWMNLGTEGMGEVERSRHIKAEGWRMLFDDVPRAIKRGFIKVLALYSPMRTPFGEGYLVEDENGVHVENFRPYTIQMLMIPHAVLILIVGPLLLLKNWRRIPPKHQHFFYQLGVLMLLVTALHALAFGESRHRLPFDLCFMLATAYAFSQVFKTADSRRDGV